MNRAAEYRIRYNAMIDPVACGLRTRQYRIAKIRNSAKAS
jgi:hypothetical protein